MQKRELGGSGLEVSTLVLGCMRQGRRGSDATRIEIVRSALDAGITSLDTAPLYDFGHSEELVGKAVRGRREGTTILTKVGLRWDAPWGEVAFEADDGQGRRRIVRRNSRPDSVRLEVERSLSRLGVEFIDLIQVHARDPLTPVEDTIGELEQLRVEGKVRAIGVSNFGTDDMLRAQAALGDPPLASNQVHYNLVERRVEDELVACATARKTSLLCYSPLERGLLAGTIPEQGLTPGDPRSGSPHFHPRNIARVKAASRRSLAPIAATRGVDVSVIALAWLLAQPGVAGVIVGASSADQVRRNASAGNIELTQEETRRVRTAFEAIRIDPFAGCSLRQRAAGIGLRALRRGRRRATKLLRRR